MPQVITITSFGRTLVDDVDAATARTTLGVVPGTDVLANVVPSTSGNVLTSNGSAWTSAAPAGGGLTVGTTTITSGTSGRVGYNNAGVYGEYPITGTGNVAMSASPTFTGTVTAAAITASGQVSVPSGTSGAPSLCFTGTTTGVYYAFGGMVFAVNGNPSTIAAASGMYSAFNGVFGWVIDGSYSGTDLQLIRHTPSVMRIGNGTGNPGRLLIASSSESCDSQLFVRPSSAGTIGQIVKGAVSQTANLQEWQDSAGTVAASLNLGNAASTSSLLLAGTWFTGGSTTTTKPQLLVEPTGTTSTGWSPNGTGIGVNAASGFTGNLLDLQVAGVRKAALTSTGDAVLIGSLAVGGGISGATQVIVIPQSAGTIGQIIKGAASRTAQLQQFQTSAADSLGNVSGGCFADIISTTSTTSVDGTFDTLSTITFVANSLIVNGDKHYFDYTLTIVQSQGGVATRNVKLTFAGITIFDSGAVVFFSNATMRIRGYISRVTSSTCIATVSVEGSQSISGSPFFVSSSTLTGLTLTGTNNLVLSAAAAGVGAASADISLVQGTAGVTGYGS
jgi:hypothetical protein